jgi:hypothetical protein
MVVVIFGLDGACDSRHVGGILEFPGLSPGPFFPAIVAIYPCACSKEISDLLVDLVSRNTMYTNRRSRR